MCRRLSCVVGRFLSVVCPLLCVVCRQSSVVCPKLSSAKRKTLNMKDVQLDVLYKCSVAWRVVSVVGCLLSVVCCLLSVVCRRLSVVCCLLSVVWRLLSVVCCLFVCCRLYVVCNEGCWLERLTGLGWPRLLASGLAGLENDRAQEVIICRAAPSVRWLRNLVW